MSSPSRISLFFLWLGWTFATWLALAGSAFGLVFNPDRNPEIPTWHWLLAWILPPVAMICGWLALRAGTSLWRGVRVIFWTGATAGVALIAALLKGRMEISSQSNDSQLLLAVALLPLLPFIFALVCGIRSGGLKAAGLGWLLDIPLGILCASLLVVAGGFTWIKIVVAPIRVQAIQRWADIGHPMADFEKSLKSVDENSSLHDLTADLEPFGVPTLYKSALVEQSKQIKSLQTPPELQDLYVSTSTIPGDWIRNVPKASAWLDAHVEDFNHLYEGILRRDPPVWNCNPSDGFAVQLPDMLAMNKISELICCDAYHRIQKNDPKAAANAIEAGRRIVRNLGEQPIMVSNMTYANIESLYAPVLARLTVEPDDLQSLAKDVAASRKQFARTVQWEAWHAVRDMESMNTDTRRLFPVQPLPAGLGRDLLPFYSQSLGRYHGAEAWLYQADVVDISEKSQDAPDAIGADFGSHAMEASYVAHPSPFNINWSRPWLRVNFMLLIREQAAMIRYARTQMQPPKSGNLGDRDSVVIPGAKWHINGDATKNNVTLTLSPIPDWAADTSVTGADFFLIPLDGRRAWQLLPAPPRAQ